MGSEETKSATGNGRDQCANEEDEVFADGDYIWYISNPDQPLRGKVLAFDGTAYDIKLDIGNEMTVRSQFLKKCTDLPPPPPTNDSDGLDDFGDSDSDVTGVNHELPPWRGKERSQGDSDDDTVTEVSLAVHHSVADQKSRQESVSGAKPPLVFVNPKDSVPETKQVEKTITFFIVILVIVRLVVLLVRIIRVVIFLVRQQQ